MTSEQYQPTRDQIDRKTRSNAILTSAGVRLNDWLPVLEDVAAMVLRTPQEIANRLLALAIVAVKAEGLEQGIIESIVEERDIRASFTPKETIFIDNPTPTHHDRIQFVWRYEAAWVLLWALRLTDAPLGLPTKTCDVSFLSQTVRDTEDLTIHGLRSLAEIADEADLIFRCHWAVRQSSLDRLPAGGDLDPGVTMERHYALNWLVGSPDKCEWDDVGTAT